MYGVYTHAAHSCMQTTSNAISEIEFFAGKCTDGVRVKAHKRSSNVPTHFPFTYETASPRRKRARFPDPLKIAIGNIRVR